MPFQILEAFLISGPGKGVKCSLAKLHLTLRDPMDCSLPVPWSVGFSRQEYWGGLLFPPSGDLPDPGI